MSGLEAKRYMVWGKTSQHKQPYCLLTTWIKSDAKKLKEIMKRNRPRNLYWITER